MSSSSRRELLRNMSEPIYNIIFDEPFLRERDVTLEPGPSEEERLNRALDLKQFKRLAKLYIGALMAQYILVFVSVPFEYIENRPPISVFHELLFDLYSMLIVLC